MIRANTIRALFLTSLSACFGLCGSVPRSAAQESARSAQKITMETCPVTLPPKPGAKVNAMSFFVPGTSQWKPVLHTGPFGLAPDGTMLFGPGGGGSIEPDGSLAMKFGWTRGEGVRGKLRIRGRRLDASATPLRASIPDGYGETGFQVSGLIFPTEGCWEVTGEVGEVRTSFVTRVVRIQGRTPGK